MKLLKVKMSTFFSVFCAMCWSVSPLEFQRAALNGSTKIIEDGLREKGYEYVQLLDKDHNTPLHLAACTKKGGSKADIISLLIKYGADINATNRYFSTPLHIAVSTNNIEGTKILLKEKGIHLNTPSSSNMTPLMYAIAIRSLEMMTLLLAHSEIDPNQDNTDGMTPLHLAAKWGFDKEVALLLKDDRTNPHPKQQQGDFVGATPLHYAAMQAQPKIVKLLLEQKRGVDIHATVTEGLYEGFTAVHCAVMNPNTPQVFECLKLLVQNGAKVNVKTKQGKLPSDLTNVRVILEFLADPNPTYELKAKRNPTNHDF